MRGKGLTISYIGTCDLLLVLVRSLNNQKYTLSSSFLRSSDDNFTCTTKQHHTTKLLLPLLQIKSYFLFAIEFVFIFITYIASLIFINIFNLYFFNFFVKYIFLKSLFKFFLFLPPLYLWYFVIKEKSIKQSNCILQKLAYKRKNPFSYTWILIPHNTLVSHSTYSNVNLHINNEGEK